jgi:hypothetical protein
MGHMHVTLFAPLWPTLLCAALVLTSTGAANVQVVQILLGSNHLVGSISRTLVSVAEYEASPTLRNLAFYNLQVLNMEANQLTGPFPIWLTHLPHLATVRLINNSFDLNRNDEAAIASMCNQASVNCTGAGLPGWGGTCNAFGPRAVMQMPARRYCHMCKSSEQVLREWYSMLWFVLIPLFVLYAAMVHTYAQGGYGCTWIGKQCTAIARTHLKGWVACSCIMVQHLQTTALIGGATTSWPDHVHSVLGECKPRSQTSLRRKPRYLMACTDCRLPTSGVRVCSVPFSRLHVFHEERMHGHPHG